MSASWSRRSLLRALGAAGVVWAAPACLSLKNFPFDRGGEPVPGLKVQFFSVACFLVELGDVAVLTDPFFSHLRLGHVVEGPVVPDPAQVDPYRHLLGNVRAVVVGHSHYDHVLDLPEVAPDLAPDALVLGSQTLLHIYGSTDLPLQMRSVNDLRAGPDSPGTWVDVLPGRLRILAIHSGHPDNVPGIHFYQKRLTDDLPEPPHRAKDFQEGETIAYLIDFLDGERILWRVYTQSSSRGLPDGLFPDDILAEHGVDVALLAMDCARAEAAGRESIIDRLQPTEVLFCHYADFFRPKDEPPREGVKVKLRRTDRLLVDTETTRYRFPAWDEAFHFQKG